MGNKEWLARVEAAAPMLRIFVSDWHPASPRRSQEQLEITAQGAEATRRVLERQIRHESSQIGHEPAHDPLARFNAALAGGDTSTLMSILNQCWLGVPESTECWGLTGFREAVDLLDDPPEDEE